MTNQLTNQSIYRCVRTYVRPAAKFPKSNRLAFPGDASSVPRAAATILSRNAIRVARKDEEVERYAAVIRDFDFRRFTSRHEEEKAQKALREGTLVATSQRHRRPGSREKKSAPPEKNQPGGTVALLSKFEWYKGPPGRSGGHRPEGVGALLPVVDAHHMLVSLQWDLRERLREHHARRALVYQAACALGAPHAQRVVRSFLSRRGAGRKQELRLLGWQAPWAARLCLQTAARGYLVRKKMGMMAEFPRLPRGPAIRRLCARASGEAPPMEPRYLTRGDLLKASLLISARSGNRKHASAAQRAATADRYELARQLREGLISADEQASMMRSSTMHASHASPGGAPRTRIRRKKKQQQDEAPGTPATPHRKQQQQQQQQQQQPGSPDSKPVRGKALAIDDGLPPSMAAGAATGDADGDAASNALSEGAKSKEQPPEAAAAAAAAAPFAHMGVPTVALVVGRNDGGRHRAVWEQETPANAFDFGGIHGCLAVSLSRRFSGPRQRLAAMHALLSAVLIQSVGRVFIAKRKAAMLRFASYEYCVQRIQMCWRTFLAKRRLRELAKEAAMQSHIASTMIQVRPECPSTAIWLAGRL